MPTNSLLYYNTSYQYFLLKIKTVGSPLVGEIYNIEIIIDIGEFIIDEFQNRQTTL